MTLFPQRNPKDSIADQEQTLLDYWKQHEIFERSIKTRSPRNVFKFFDGPPFATGKPHYGHVLAGAIKDAIPRYYTMKGYRVDRKFGWDCHGVPVEFQVEKEMGIGGKEGIEKMGIGKFNETCRSIVMRCRDDWEETVDRMGRFVDFKDDYKTMDTSFMESVWWVFGELWKKDLIYRGEKVIAYSPKLGSPLSNFEANLNYKDIDDPAVTVKFELKNEPGTYVLAWTTTPWTLPSNLGLCVRADMRYLKYSVDGGKTYYIFAENYLDKFSQMIPSIVNLSEGVHVKGLNSFLGKELVGKVYKPLFPFFEHYENAFRIFADDYVADDSGTGVVHLAPTGEDDARILQDHNVELVYPFTQNCYFDDTIPELKGKYFRKDDVVEGSAENNVNDWVCDNLKERELLFRPKEQIRHSYPHCWRTDCALMYRGIDTWFVAVKKIKDRMIELNQDINWLPEHLKDGRFGKTLEGAPDWAISRNRYWGTPIPVWICDKTGQTHVVTSRAELEYLTGKSVPDLHKHNIDKLTWKNEVTEGTMRRIPEVLDCWFESGSMPYASVHYPYKEKPVAKESVEVYVARHGQSENNILGIESCKFETQTRFGLVYPGRQQCLAEAKRLKEQGITFDVILSSPFRRTVESAEIFQSLCGGELFMEERLRETDIGDFDMEPYDKVTNAIQNQPVDVRFQRGESIVDLYARLQAVWDEVLQQYKGKRVLLVTHGSPLLTLQRIVTGKKVAMLGGLDELPENGKAMRLGGEEEEQNMKESRNKSGTAEFHSADFIAEGLDQTRGWFYTLHVLGTALFDKPIYKNVVTNGIVLAEDGAKMSKSKQNYPDPMKVINQYGADAMRYYLLSSPVVKGENLRFSEHGVAEVLKSVILPIKSAYQFLSTYANIDGWKPTTFVVMRHGEAEHNKAFIYSGNVKNPHCLTEKGKEEVAKTVKNIPTLDALYHSPFVRTTETKDIVIKETGFKGTSVEDERIKEACFGSLEGKPLIGRKDRFAGDFGGESLESMMERAQSFIDDARKNHSGQTVGLVSHGDMFALFHMLLNDIEPTDLDTFVKIPFVSPGQAKAYFDLPNPTTELDAWILSETQELLRHVREKMDAYDLESALHPLPAFIDKLNNWYLRRSRKRFWASGMNVEKQSGYETLHYVLLTLSKILAPICPFYADLLYQDLGGLSSVHLAYFPHALDRFNAPEVTEKIELEREIASLAAGIRAEKKIKLRQPLGKVQFYTTSNIKIDTDIIAQEANVKVVEMISSLEGIAQPIVRVDARQVGKKFGPKVQELIKAGKEGNFKELDGGAVEVAGERLEPGEFEKSFTCEEGMEAASTIRSVVLLDTNITPELECEGVAREIIRSIQDMRKSSGFEVTDRIKISYQTDSEILKNAFKTHESMILEEVLGTDILDSSAGEEILIDGEKVMMKLLVV